METYIIHSRRSGSILEITTNYYGYFVEPELTNPKPVFPFCIQNLKTTSSK